LQHESAYRFKNKSAIMRSFVAISTCVLSLLLGAAPPANAYDSDGVNAVMGVGNESCGSYIDARRHDNDIRYRAWLGGFLSYASIEIHGVKDILEGTDIPGAMLRLENYCKLHPTKYFADAAIEFVISQMEAIADAAEKEAKALEEKMTAQDRKQEPTPKPPTADELMKPYLAGKAAASSAPPSPASGTPPAARPTTSSDSGASNEKLNAIVDELGEKNLAGKAAASTAPASPASGTPPVPSCPPRTTYEAASSWVHDQRKCERHLTPYRSWVEWGEYCPDGATGFFFLKRTGEQKAYLFEHMPPEVWAGFKDAHAAGVFYNKEIKGLRYRFRLAAELDPAAPELTCAKNAANPQP
jgi:hypothetical protein